MKSLKVKNFTGTVTRLPNGQVRISGRGGKRNPGGVSRLVSEYKHQRKGGTPRVKAIKRAVKSVTPNPKRRVSKQYTVRIPKTSYDTGYVLSIKAITKAAARKQARAYCAKQYAKMTGRTQKSYRLPTGTKVTEG
jgi:hypothetical protein